MAAHKNVVDKSALLLDSEMVIASAYRVDGNVVLVALEGDAGGFVGGFPAFGDGAGRARWHVNSGCGVGRDCNMPLETTISLFVPIANDPAM